MSESSSSPLSSCPACAGFVPVKSRRCPHCSARMAVAGSDTFRRIAKAALALSSGSAMCMTLMACYGLPPCQSSDDADGDGYFGGACQVEDGSDYDCDDGDATIHPGAEDVLGDGIDQNCDGEDGIAPLEPIDAGSAPSSDAGTPSDGGS